MHVRSRFTMDWLITSYVPAAGLQLQRLTTRDSLQAFVARQPSGHVISRSPEAETCSHVTRLAIKILTKPDIRRSIWGHVMRCVNIMTISFNKPSGGTQLAAGRKPTL